MHAQLKRGFKINHIRLLCLNIDKTFSVFNQLNRLLDLITKIEERYLGVGGDMVLGAPTTWCNYIVWW